MKYFIIIFCVIVAQTSGDVLTDVENEFKDVGKKIAHGFEVAEKEVVKDYHKVEDEMKIAGTEIAEFFKKAAQKTEMEAVKDYKKVKEEMKEVGTEIVTFYNKVEGAVEEEVKALEKAVMSSCSCVDYNCGCCVHLEEHVIDLNATICTNISYLVHDYGISFTVTVNGFAIFNETVSARNPPPVCLGAPYVKELADVCLRLYDINATTNHLHVCIRIEARMKMVLIAKYDLGCIDIGPRGIYFGVIDKVKNNFNTLVNRIKGIEKSTENTQGMELVPITVSDFENLDSVTLDPTDTGMIYKVKNDFDVLVDKMKDIDNNLNTENAQGMELSEIQMTMQSTLDMEFVPITVSDLENLDAETFDPNKTDYNFDVVRMETRTVRTNVVFPVLAVLAVVILITVVVIIVVKRKRDGRRLRSKYMKHYGSTSSLVSNVDPYC